MEAKEKISAATQSVKRWLRPVDSISDSDARNILKRYTAAIEGNFLAWMGAASISARSPISKFAADENLWVEIKDNHPGMLRDFARNAQAEPDSSDFQYVQSEVDRLRNLTGELSGLKNITLMTVLENTSAAFIPYLADLAKKLGSSDSRYTDIHGVADIKHADQFLTALMDEQSLRYGDAGKDIDITIENTLLLLKKIFT